MRNRLFSLLLMILVFLSLPAFLIAGSVQLSWQPNTEADLQGYNLYYGTESRQYGPPMPADKTAQITLSELEEGVEYYFAVSAVDTAGNESGFSEEISKLISSTDPQLPVVYITSPVEAETYTSNKAVIDLAGTAGDNDSIKQITWSSSTGANGIASGTASWSISGINLAEGQNVITVTATDASGNQTSDTITVSYTAPDTQAPEVTITAPAVSPDGAYQATSSTLQLSGTAQDDHGVAKVTWSMGDTGGIAEGTTNWSVSAIPLNEGLNTITVTAEDEAGNPGSTSILINYAAPDTTLPVIAITSPVTAETYTSNQTTIDLAGTAGDNDSIKQITWRSSTGANGVASGTASWSIAGINLVEGQNVITVTAADASGNQASDTISVSYTAPDTQAPVVTITIPAVSPDGAYQATSSTLQLSGTAQDDHGVAKVTWSMGDAGGIAEGTTNWSISGISLASGTNVITVTATDVAGNQSSAKLTVTYEAADTTAPSVKITSPTTKSSYFSRTATVDIGGTASDNSGIDKVVWKNSRGESGTCNGTDTWQASGIKINRWWNTITVTAIDSAGNTETYFLKVFRWK